MFVYFVSRVEKRSFMGMKSIKTWLKVVRLPSLMLTLSSSLVGTAVSISAKQWRISVCLLTVLTAALLQVIANLANDYGDFLRGAGVGDRVVAVPNKKPGSVQLRQIIKALWVLVMLTIGCGLLLLHMAQLTLAQWLFFILLGGVAMVAAITYTMGMKPYGYHGWGDVSVFLFFGGVGVLGTAYLHTKTWIPYLWPAVSCGCFAVAVLNLNNLRDRADDAKVGKRTLVVKMGTKSALYLQWVVLCLGILGLMMFTLQHGQHPIQWIFLMTIPLLIRNGVLTMRLSPRAFDGLLQQLVIIQFVTVILFSYGLIISSI
eukprot:gene77-103_t